MVGEVQERNRIRRENQNPTWPNPSRQLGQGGVSNGVSVTLHVFLHMVTLTALEGGLELRVKEAELELNKMVIL